MADLPYSDVAVVGAGIVGASTALWLQREGFGVRLLDGQAPGSGASYGNACTIANYGCVPINTPRLFSQLPRLLFSRNSPLRIDWVYALTHLPWQISFLRNCSRRRVAHICTQLGNLLRHTDAGIDPLLDHCDAHDQVAAARGIMYVYSTEASFRIGREDAEIRTRNSWPSTSLGADEVRRLEPRLQIPVAGGFLFEGTRFLKDPQALVQRYVQQVVDDGGELVSAQVRAVEPDANGVTVLCADGQSFRCTKLVVAAGAWSRTIRGSGMERLPLDTERGYHVMFKNHGGLVTRPIAWADGGFYTTSMQHGLRLAGTVELAGLKPEANRSRLEYLTRRAHQMFGDIGQPDETWLGFRPTFPDSLPVIGESPRSQNIYLATGHQHIGLTAAGITGKLIAELIAGRKTTIDLAPFSAGRFR